MKLILPLLISILACAQTRSPAPEAPTPNLPAQKIGNNDLIAVAVYNSPEFTRTIRVGDDGHIRFPMLKRQINAFGLLPDQLEQSIRDAIEAARSARSVATGPNEEGSGGFGGEWLVVRH